MIPVVMSGGSGTRLWPLSRVKLPKQFCELFEEPLQTMTLRRLSSFGKPWIVTSAVLKDLTELHLGKSGIQAGELLFEPQGKNTAAAIALVCRVLELQGKAEEVVGIFPADHLVTKEKKFREALEMAEKIAAQGKIVTLGIRPSHPETGFGYIQTDGAPLATEGEVSAFPVTRFHEKPELQKAKDFVADGRYCWNAGIFVFRASRMNALLEKHEPEVWKPLRELKSDLSNLGEVYANVKSISIDYAVMEKLGGTGDLVCLPVDIGWSDVGSWDAVANEASLRSKDIGADVHLIDSKNVYVHSPEGKSVTVIGLEGLQIVDTGDALLISRAGESQKVREVVERLSKKQDSVVSTHPFEDFSWGRIEVLRATPHFRSRFLTINAKQKLPAFASSPVETQWTVTRGRGEAIVNGEARALKEGDSLRLPAGIEAELQNPSGEALEILEVQTGLEAARP